MQQAAYPKKKSWIIAPIYVARVASVLLLDEESDALHKINDVFIKIQNTNTLDVKTCPQSC